MTFHKIIAEDILNSSISWKFAQLFNILQKMYEIVGSCGEGRDYLQNLDEKRLALQKDHFMSTLLKYLKLDNAV